MRLRALRRYIIRGCRAPSLITQHAKAITTDESELHNHHQFHHQFGRRKKIEQEVVESDESLGGRQLLEAEAAVFSSQERVVSCPWSPGMVDDGPWPPPADF